MNLNYKKESDTIQDTIQETIQDTIQDDLESLIEYCSIPRTRIEMMQFMNLNNRSHFTAHYLKPLLASNKLVMTIPEKPNSKNQKYVKKS